MRARSGVTYTAFTPGRRFEDAAMDIRIWSIAASVFPAPIGAETNEFLSLTTTGYAFNWIGVGLLMPALDSRVRNARSAAMVNIGRSVLLLLRGIMLVNEQSDDGRYEYRKSDRTSKREELSWRHLIYNITPAHTIIKAYKDKPL